jgi:hypothetical protein
MALPDDQRHVPAQDDQEVELMYARVVTLAAATRLGSTSRRRGTRPVRRRRAGGLDEMQSFMMLVDHERARSSASRCSRSRRAAAQQQGARQAAASAPDAGGRPVSVDVYEIPSTSSARRTAADA